MKNVRLLVVLVGVTLVAATGANAWFDGFEDYAAGSGIIDQGTWVGWNRTGTDDAPVTDAIAASGEKSLQLGGEAMVDLVPEFTGVTSGVWTMTAQTYIPENATTGYFDIGWVTWDEGAQAHIWCGAISFDLPNGTVEGTLPLVRDQWIEAKAVFDVDAMTVATYYNGVESNDPGGFGEHEVAGLDIWTAEGTSTLYIDDISMVPEPATMALLGLGALALLRKRRV